MRKQQITEKCRSNELEEDAIKNLTEFIVGRK